MTLTIEEHRQWMADMSAVSTNMALKQKQPNDARYYAIQAAHQAFESDPSLREESEKKVADGELRYSNPRMKAIIEDWPSGSRRVVARFEIEQKPGKGERAVRITTGAAKKLTFAKMARIVDGSDGLTYIAEFTGYGFISIMKGDMKFQQEAIFAQDLRYNETLELFARS